MATDFPFNIVSPSWSKEVKRGWIKDQELGLRSGEASPCVGAGAPLRGGGEDAALGVEDGDCVEAAEKPPELMPGERTGRTPTQNL